MPIVKINYYSLLFYISLVLKTIETEINLTRFCIIKFNCSVGILQYLFKIPAYKCNQLAVSVLKLTESFMNV